MAKIKPKKGQSSSLTAGKIVRLVFIGAIILVALENFSGQSIEQLTGQVASNASDINNAMKRSGGTNTTASLAYYQDMYRSWGQKDISTDEGIAPDIVSRNYYVILDTSGSMNNGRCAEGRTKMSVAKESLTRWMEHVGPDDNVALMTFKSTHAQEVLPLSRNTAAYKKQFLDTVQTLPANGSTPLGDSLNKAFEYMDTQAARQLGYGEYHIVVLTDGEATDPDIMDAAARKIYNSPVVLHTIGFCLEKDHALNKPGYSFYMNAMNQDELDKGLQQVLAESEYFDITGFQ